MKINPKRLRQIFANSFILITAVTFVSCTQASRDIFPIPSTQPKTEIVQAINQPIKAAEIVVIPTNEEKQLDILNNEKEDNFIDIVYSFIDENIDTSCINNTTEYFVDNIEKLLSISSLTKEQQILAMYAYRKLVTANINSEVFERELNNMMVEQICPRCISDEDWKEYFGTLSETLDEEESLGDTYITLAWLIHNQFCDDDHSYNQGIIKCKSLIKQFDDKYSK